MKHKALLESLLTPGLSDHAGPLTKVVVDDDGLSVSLIVDGELTGRRELSACGKKFLNTGADSFIETK
jgi:hypothetical protein